MRIIAIVTLGWHVALLSPRELFCQQQRLEFEHLSVEDGLSHGSVYSIIQDATGFMWFATEDGLNRYDGIGLTIYRHEPGNADSLTASNFGEVLQEESGVMWFGTWGGGLDRFDPKTARFRHYRHDPDDPGSLSQDRIEVLYEDLTGSLWIGTEEAGVNLYDPATDRFIRYRHDPADPNSLSHDEIRAIGEDTSGGLWIGTNGGLSRFDRERQTFTHYRHDTANSQSLSHNRVRAIVPSRSGGLWIGTRGAGLNRLDITTGIFEHYRHLPDDPESLSDDSISCLLEDSSGILWIGTYSRGLNRFDPATGAFRRFIHDERNPASLRHDSIEALYEDRARNLWVGTRGGGLAKLDLKPSKFRNDDHLPGRSGPAANVRALAVDTDRTLWIGTNGDGLFRSDSQGHSLERLRHEPADPTTLSGDRIWSLTVDRAGVLWIGTYSNGLNRLETENGSYQITRFQHDPKDPTTVASDRVQALLEDRDGILWLGTNRGLSRASPTNDQITFITYQHDPQRPSSLSSNYVSVILQDRSGTLWLGTRLGLNSFDTSTGTFENYIHDPQDSNSLSGNFVYDIHEERDEDGVLWVGIEDGGLNRFEVATGRSRRYLVADGLPSHTVAGILEDDRGYLWLSTSSGLSRFDPETEKFRNYGVSDGLNSHSFFRNADLKTPEGMMYFGGISGLTSFSPEAVIDNPHLPDVALTSLEIMGQEAFSVDELIDMDELELSYWENSLTIEFAALDFTAPKANQYAYRMSDVAPDWIRAGNRNFANYVGLQPGTYEFEVKASNNNGVWNEDSRTLTVRVKPPWWQTWWLRVGMTLLLVAAIFSVHAFRTHVIRTRNRELETVNRKLNDQIAERRRAEQEKEELIVELGARATEMERFIYTVSHDLKSPLITIKGFMGMVRQDALDGKTDRMISDLDRIGSAADKMHHLLDDLLELSRIGRKLNPPQRVSLQELAEEARELVAGQIAERQAHIDIQPGLPEAFGDRARLLEVFQNLIDNAVKFSDRAPQPRVTIGTQKIDGEAVLFVRDNGRGIDPQYGTQIFELFERLDTETQGTGVGLTLVQRIVELHGGRIWVESEGEDLGATFYFTLPAQETAEGTAPG